MIIFQAIGYFFWFIGQVFRTIGFMVLGCMIAISSPFYILCMCVGYKSEPKKIADEFKTTGQLLVFLFTDGMVFKKEIDEYNTKHLYDK